jgi:hypothetical protein
MHRLILRFKKERWTGYCHIKVEIERFTQFLVQHREKATDPGNHHYIPEANHASPKVPSQTY